MANPFEMMQFAERINTFKSQHPRALNFFGKAFGGEFREGTIIEMKVTDPDGNETIGNIKVTAEDLKTIEMLKSML
ncbi:MAG: hypothetical protein K5894_07265 [Lachnospiraceae bacterium]|nr:hypothetical protein [Lachnospiraceae bacterium]MDN4745228.1 hypothetical protein [Lachnospiraceae bacterium C1.1]